MAEINRAEAEINSKEKKWSLKGMTALVSGGTTVIEHARVGELAGLGTGVHTCSRNQTVLDQCLQEWRSTGFGVTGSVCDLLCRDQREKLMETISSVFHGKLNILVNNAGMAIHKDAVEFTADDISTIMVTNFESSYHLCQLAHPFFKASGNGSIVFNSSILSAVAISFSSIYAVSKDPFQQDPRNKKRYDVIISRAPIFRPGETNEVSLLVAFLCFHAASCTTGQVILVDGGYTVSGFNF